MGGFFCVKKLEKIIKIYFMRVSGVTRCNNENNGTSDVSAPRGSAARHASLCFRTRALITSMFEPTQWPRPIMPPSLRVHGMQDRYSDEGRASGVTQAVQASHMG